MTRDHILLAATFSGMVASSQVLAQPSTGKTTGKTTEAQQQAVGQRSQQKAVSTEGPTTEYSHERSPTITGSISPELTSSCTFARKRLWIGAEGWIVRRIRICP